MIFDVYYNTRTRKYSAYKPGEVPVNIRYGCENGRKNGWAYWGTKCANDAGDAIEMASGRQASCKD